MDITILEREGVKIILNINELEEFSFNMINWDVITLYYPNRDIEMIDFQIFDSDTDTNKNKIKYAAFILNNLIKNSQVFNFFYIKYK